MSKQFVYLCGMPRSGSTLLCSVLSQNPDIYASSSSPLCNMLYESEMLWRRQVALGANPNDDAVIRIMKSMIPLFYQDKTQPIIIDKSFHWGLPMHLELLLRFSPTKPKFIVMERNYDDVLRSNVRMLLNNPNNKIANAEMIQPFDEDSITNFLTKPGGPLSDCIISKETVLRNFPNDSYIVKYEEFCSKPKQTIDGIYDLIKTEAFDHSFSNIKNSNLDNDLFWGIPDMHKIRPKIEALVSVGI